MGQLSYAGIAFVIAGFIKGMLGFGFPIIALSFLTLAIGLFDALAIVVVPTLVINIWQALSGRHLKEIFQRMWIYFSVAIMGILVASQYLKVVNVSLLTGLLGLILFLFALSRLFGLKIRVERADEPLLSLVLGSINGLLTGFTGSVMVPSVLYMQALGFRKDMLVQAMNVFFGLSILVFMISLGRNQLLSINDAVISTIALVPAFAGIVAGQWIRNRIDEKQFQKIFLVGMLCLGLYILSNSSLAWW